MHIASPIDYQTADAEDLMRYKRNVPAAHHDGVPHAGAYAAGAGAAQRSERAGRL